MPRFYLNESHKKQVEHALAGQAEQPKMSHAVAAAQYNRIMRYAPTAIDPTKPTAPPPPPKVDHDELIAYGINRYAGDQPQDSRLESMQESIVV